MQRIHWLGIVAGLAAVLAAGLLTLARPVRAGAPAVAPAAIVPGSAHPDLSAQTFITDFVLLPAAQYPEAVCNDGTPAGYDIQLPAEGSQQWLIYLNGGGYCSDDASCKTRWRFFQNTMSSSGWTPFDFNTKGIISSAGIFSHYNRVNMRYCSSDLWTGAHVGIYDDSNSPPHPPPFGEPIPVGNWHFRGQAIIEAALDDLFRYGLDAADQVVIVGSSAGGFGVLNNIDRYALELTTRIPGVEVRGIADAGFLYPAVPFNGSPTLAEDLLSEALMNWNGYDGINQACRTASPGEEWKCYLGGHVGYFIQNPLLVMEHQVDAFMLDQFGGVRYRIMRLTYDGQQLKGYKPSSLSNEELQYMTDYADCLPTALADMGDNLSYYLSFDPGQLLVHVLTAGEFFGLHFRFPSGLVTPEQAVTEWMAALDAGQPSLYPNYVSAIPTDLPFPPVGDCAQVALP